MAPKGTWHDLPSGLNDNFEMEITHSIFGTLETYNDQQGNPVSLLIWDYESPDHEAEFPIIWGCGSGWIIKEQGRIVQHPKRDKFIQSSVIGRLITRTIEDLKVEVDELGETWEADFWVGLKFFMKRETLTYPGAERRGLRGEVERLMPTKFLGDSKGRLDRQGRYIAAIPRQVAQPNAPVAAPPSSKSTGNSLLDKIQTLAQHSDTHDAFVKMALRIPEISDDENGGLLNEILDASPGGLWTVTRAANNLPF